MLDAAVDMLGPDLEVVAKVLADLGAKHVSFGVLPAHYGIVGEALMHTLQTALGEQYWTRDVKQGWTVLYAFVTTAMLAGANRRMDKLKQRKARKAKINGEPVVPLHEKEESRLTIPNEVLTQLNQTSALSQSARKRLDELAESLRNDCSVSGSRASGGGGGGGDEDNMTQTTCSSSEEDGEVDYSKMVETVSSSWDVVKQIPNVHEVAGVLLFRK